MQPRKLRAVNNNFLNSETWNLETMTNIQVGPTRSRSIQDESHYVNNNFKQ